MNTPPGYGSGLPCSDLGAGFESENNSAPAALGVEGGSVGFVSTPALTNQTIDELNTNTKKNVWTSVNEVTGVQQEMSTGVESTTIKTVVVNGNCSVSSTEKFDSVERKMQFVRENFIHLKELGFASPVLSNSSEENDPDTNKKDAPDYYIKDDSEPEEAEDGDGDAEEDRNSEEDEQANEKEEEEEDGGEEEEEEDGDALYKEWRKTSNVVIDEDVGMEKNHEEQENYDDFLYKLNKKKTKRKKQFLFCFYVIYCLIFYYILTLTFIFIYFCNFFFIIIIITIYR